MKAKRLLLSVLLGLLGFLLWGQRAEAAGTTLSSLPNACWTTEQPFTLVEDDKAQLTWDVYGNLTLLNDAGGKSRVAWGLNSPVPLVGAAAGKLCFGNGAGHLRIHDAAGNMVWVSGSYTATNGTLSINQCTIQIADTNGVVQWQQSTPGCDTRSLTTPPPSTSLSSIPNVCWSTEQPFVLLEDDKAALTWDEYGNLTLANVGGDGSKVSWGLGSPVPLKGANAGMLCFGNGAGHLRIHDAAGNMVWVSGSYTATNGTLSIDQCTMMIKDTGGVVRWQASTPSCTQIAKPAPVQSANVLPASSTCWTTEQPFTLVENDLARLTWEQNGNLTLTNFAGSKKSVSWGIGASAALTGASRASLCFDWASGLRIVDSAGNQVWSASATSLQNAYLTLDACTAEIKDGNGVIRWRESTPMCDKRSIAQPSSTMQWTNDVPNRILWDDDHNIALWFTSEGLFLTKDGNTQFIWHTSQSATVYYDSAGELFIGFAWTSFQLARRSQGQGAMSLDANGLFFTDGVWGYYPLPVEYKRFDVGPRPSTVDAGWCRTTESPGTIVQSGNMHLDWTSDGRLGLFVGTGTTPVRAFNSSPGNLLCFGKRGRLSVYVRETYESPWNSESVGDSSFSWQLTLDGCHIRIAEARIDEICARFHAQDLENCSTGGCTPAEQDEWSLATLYCDLGTDNAIYNDNVRYCDPNVSGNSFSFVKDMKSGNSDFGAELWAVGAAINTNGIDSLVSAADETGARTIDADLPLGHTPPPSGYFEVLGDAGTSITLFGANVTVLDAGGYVENLNGPRDHVAVTSLGATLYTLDEAGIADAHWSKEFFEMDETYTLGCIPVTVHAGVTGTIGVHANVYPNVTSDVVTGFTGSLEPYASLDLDASVGVGTSGASAGVEGDLELVRLSFPFTLNITSFSNRTYTTTLDFSVQTLEGEIDLYAKLGSLKASKEIASFHGDTTSANLFTQSGSL